jgi:hypothetical protein
MFHSEGLRTLGIDPATLWPKVLPRPPAEQQLERARNSFIRNIPRKRSKLSRLFGRKPGAIPDSNQLVPSLPTEEELELADALQPIYDRLSLSRGWWILEILPVRQADNDRWVWKMKVNLGKGRYIPGMRMPDVGVKVHRSVKMRMEAQYPDGKRYVPKAKLVEKYVTWVD